jgi:ATP-dependent RNA helicase DDX27
MIILKRLEKLNSFKDNSIDILVATDLAARGLDIDNVKTVINFTMPLTYKNYIHRVGRTARAQQSGRSISLVAESDRWLLKEIIKSSKEPVKCRVVPQDVIEHFRAKCETIRAEVGQLVNEEREESMLKDMETDVSF